MAEEIKPVELEDDTLENVAGGVMIDDNLYLKGDTIAAPSHNEDAIGHVGPHRVTTRDSRIPLIPFFPASEPGRHNP